MRKGETTETLTRKIMYWSYIHQERVLSYMNQSTDSCGMLNYFSYWLNTDMTDSSKHEALKVVCGV